MTRCTGIIAVMLCVVALHAPWPARAAQSGAAVGNIAYEIRFDAGLAATHDVRVSMSFDVAARGPVELSLPAWTPGAYRVANFARNVIDFEAESGGDKLEWDKTDFDTWRVQAPAGRVRVSFLFMADTLDNAGAWTQRDFLMLNGTNVFLYPEGNGHDFPASLTITTEPEWRVATGMRRDGGRYREASFHDLVDMPLFIGRFDLDSVSIEGKWHRLATYPEGEFSGEARTEFWEQLQRMVPVMTRVFGESPWDTYTTLLVFDANVPGGAALEHQNSHVGLYNPAMIGNAGLPLITAHEIFHAWNVKRLRPADLVPYRYDRPQATPWLWMSEGITDYYADLALVRSGVAPAEFFYALTNSKMAAVAATPPVALEDASVNAWLNPRDGTQGIYYPKGSLAGLLLDILIRDASGNRSSLDAVMRELYVSTFKRGRGFTAEDWWSAVRRAAGGRPFEDEYRRYIDGREPYPWASVLPRAGMKLVTDSLREPRLGISVQQDAGGVRINAVTAAGMAARAGIEPGDYLESVGGTRVSDISLGQVFRQQYARQPEGTVVPIEVRRGNETILLKAELRFEVRAQSRIEADAAAGERARRIREGILSGAVRPG
jgi:predicted metalloprotease with PDZ domain